jgi:hypothetical protein
MEIYQIVLIIVIISVIVSIGLYINQVMVNNSIRADFEKTNNCKFDEQGDCINSSGKKEWGKGITPPPE